MLSEDKCYIWVDGRKYDLTSFALSHPGGKYVLNEFNNKDATLFYYSTHKYKSIHKLFTSIKAVNQNTNKVGETDISYNISAEYIQLTKDVYKLLNNNTFAPICWHIRACTLMVLQCLFWYLSTILFESISMIIIFRILHGFVMGLTGLCVLHDAGHSSISRNVWVNRIYMYISVDLLSGVSSQFWRIRHNYLHHVYSNTIIDPDFDILPIASTQFHYRYFKHEIRWFHKFQQFYIFILFQLYPVKVHFIEIWSLLISKKVWSYSIPKSAQFETKINCILKIVFLAYYYLVPFYFYNTRNGFDCLTSILLIHISNIISGTYDGVFFLLSHNFVGSQTFYNDNNISNNEKHVIELDWAKSQIESASNHSGNVCAFFCGSLNYQIEHHLFPRINSMHYPKLLAAVSRFAKKNGIKYVHFDTIYKNLSSTINSFDSTKWK